MFETVERFQATDSRLGRHVRHDNRSFAYRLDTRFLTIQPVKWERHIPIFDQKKLGSCTGNAGVGCVGTGPNWDAIISKGIPPKYTSNETGAIDLYSAATQLDSDPQNYPPTDTGSDGLSVAKALLAAGEISGYQHTFTLDDALKALTIGPLMFGTVWYNSMFNPVQGHVTVDPKSGVAGGHEIVCDEYTTDGYVGFTNSWGESWGLNGRFYMKITDFGNLMNQKGDIILLTPITQPAPIPTPTPPPTPTPSPAPVSADDILAAKVMPWANKRHYGATKTVAQALLDWDKVLRPGVFRSLKGSSDD